ncbi:MAG: lipid-A-disaccharide synthase [Luteolibacter sp.]
MPDWFLPQGAGAGVFAWSAETLITRLAAMGERIYVVAGELSGDAHGAGLLRELQALRPGLEVRGAGGPQMAKIAGGGFVDWVEDAAVMGVWEVLKKYGWFRKRFARMLSDLREFQPQVLLLIDYPGFNLRFAEAVRWEFPKIRIVQYISPKVWAWNKRRIPKMARIFDEVLCLFPFEVAIFEAAGLKASFVGNPLVDQLQSVLTEDISRDSNLVGLFPGSREREVERLFPMMIEVAERMRNWRSDLKFEVPAATEKLAAKICGLIDRRAASEWISVRTGGSHQLMRQAGCGVIASGTATLEAACLGIPYCLVYRVAPLTYFLAKLLVKIEFIGLVNIIAGERVVGELVQSDANAEKVGEQLKRLIESPEYASRMRERLASVSAMLGEPGVESRAAARVADWFKP